MCIGIGLKGGFMGRIGNNSGIVIALLMLTAAGARLSFAHCEIPCGIYDDEMRFVMVKEHITTIERSMQMIIELSEEGEKNYNQIVRWVTNKENHADNIQEIVSQYFLTQRIKVADVTEKEAYQKYVRQVALLHQMLVYAMRAKQSVDLSNVERLRVLLEEFEGIYFEK
jgi:nickel superoxide dismutase